MTIGPAGKSRFAGMLVNLSAAEAQVQGAILDGISRRVVPEDNDRARRGRAATGIRIRTLPIVGESLKWS